MGVLAVDRRRMCWFCLSRFAFKRSISCRCGECVVEEVEVVTAAYNLLLRPMEGAWLSGVDGRVLAVRRSLSACKFLLVAGLVG